MMDNVRRYLSKLDPSQPLVLGRLYQLPANKVRVLLLGWLVIITMAFVTMYLLRNFKFPSTDTLLFWRSGHYYFA